MPSHPLAAALPALPLEVLRHLEVGVCRLDGGLVVRGWSALLGQRGVSEEEALGRKLRSVLTPLCANREARDRVLAACQSALEGETVPLEANCLVTFPHPARPEFRLVAAPGAGLAETECLLLFVPTSDRASVRERYERILDSTPDGIMVIDPDRKVRIFNRACGELLGRSPQEVIQTSCVCGDVINCHREDGTSLANKQLCPARELFAGESASQTEQMLATNARGEERWVETSYSAISNPKGEVDFVVGILRDVHERKLLEQRLHQSEKLAALGQLTAGIAHEIKNPLGIILSSVEIILDDGREREMQREAAAFIKEEVERLDTRVRSFLAFARPRPVQPEAVVLNGLVRRTVSAFRGAMETIEIEEELHPPDTIVHLDPDQMKELLNNVLLNAAEALEDAPGRILVRTHDAGDGTVHVEVHDSGPGISAELRKKIFDPFFTTKAEGTGLGLSLAYQIASVHRGELGVDDSAELGGARFVLRLPFHSLAE